MPFRKLGCNSAAPMQTTSRIAATLSPKNCTLTYSGTLCTNTPEKAMRTRKNKIKQSAVATSALAMIPVHLTWSCLRGATQGV